MYLPASTVQALAGEVAQHTAAAHWITDITTTAFSKALGGGGSSSVAHVQATDHLPCEQILETLYMHGWKTSALRSYIRPADLAFARERIERMMAASPNPAKRPEFPPDDPTGVHRLVRA